jgi:hypothetical protein
MIDYNDDFSGPIEYEPASEDDVFATIRLDELTELIEDSKMLMCLMEQGVANWSGFEASLNRYKKETENGLGFFLKSDPE